MTDSNKPSSSEKQEVNIGNQSQALLNMKQVKVADIKEPSTSENQKIIGSAISEMEYKVELFNQLTHTCYSKCIDKRYKDGELSIGENTCIDRCVSKYYQVNNIIGQILASGHPRM